MLFLLDHLLDSAAEQFPKREAVRYSGQSLSYEELAQRSSGLAHLLIEEGVRPGERVGIYMEKSLHTVISIYGIMKAGAAYVPLDPMSPASRASFIIRDCGIRHLITSDTRRHQVDKIVERCKDLACLIGLERRDNEVSKCIPWSEVGVGTWKNAPQERTELDLAYILYTSGSTGQPKGVTHTHRSALSFVQWGACTFSLRESDRLSNHAPFHFDLSIFDLFAATAVGATTVIVPDDVARFPASVAELMSDESISVWYSVPFALVQLLQRGRLAKKDLSALRTVLFAGEPFPQKHLHELMSLLPQVSFYNLYGPTETNVCTFYPVPDLGREGGEPIPIGRACGNTTLLVVDAEGNPAGPGEIGELLVRGPTMMNGYWRRPELTEKALYRLAVNPPYEEVYYRTGDLVRAKADANLDFLGRKDRQVKIRGFRFELDEIEVALLSHSHVAEAAVYLSQCQMSDEGEVKRIEAAVIPAPGARLHEAALRRYLSELLPAYAIPERILTAVEFPRTSTGKIDRRSLQERAAQGGTSG